jgi:PAS domain S-box-containing protein
MTVADRSLPARPRYEPLPLQTPVPLLTNLFIMERQQLGALVMPDPMQAGERTAAVGQAAAWWNLLPVALIVSDGTGRIRQWAKAAPELLGYTTGEVIGRDLTDLVLPDHRREARAVHDAVAAGRSVTGQFPMRHKNGSTIGMEVWACPVAAQGGEGWDVLLLAADARLFLPVRTPFGVVRVRSVPRSRRLAPLRGDPVLAARLGVDGVHQKRRPHQGGHEPHLPTRALGHTAGSATREVSATSQ